MAATLTLCASRKMLISVCLLPIPLAFHCSMLNVLSDMVGVWAGLQGNNRVLKERPPPISDEEQILNRTQLRSGHCHLLQNYKHMLFGEPLNICTDYGASPQDVIHLFACNAHPTDLLPEDLWRDPV